MTLLKPSFFFFKNFVPRLILLNLYQHLILTVSTPEKFTGIIAVFIISGLHISLMLKSITEEFKAKLQLILDKAIEIDHADMGNIQLFDQETETLHIVAHKGFQPDFLEYFKEVKAFDSTACGRAIGLKTTIMINDIMLDFSSAPFRDIAVSAGYRAIKSVPLISSDHNPLGVLSIHYRKPHWNREVHKLNMLIHELIQLIQHD